MVKYKPQLSPQAIAKQDRLLFAAACVAAVFPGVRDDQEPKRVIFEKAATLGAKRADCPARYRNRAGDLRVFIRNKWSEIRLKLPELFDIVPVYVNGVHFGGGGGYRKGDLKHARKQLERDRKITDGVVNAANDYAEASTLVFPQIEATRTTLVSRLLEKR